FEEPSPALVSNERLHEHGVILAPDLGKFKMMALLLRGVKAPFQVTLSNRAKLRHLIAQDEGGDGKGTAADPLRPDYYAARRRPPQQVECNFPPARRGRADLPAARQFGKLTTDSVLFVQVLATSNMSISRASHTHVPGGLDATLAFVKR